MKNRHRPNWRRRFKLTPSSPFPTSSLVYGSKMIFQFFAFSAPPSPPFSMQRAATVECSLRGKRQKKSRVREKKRTPFFIFSLYSFIFRETLERKFKGNREFFHPRDLLLLTRGKSGDCARITFCLHGFAKKITAFWYKLNCFLKLSLFFWTLLFQSLKFERRRGVSAHFIWR